MLNLKITQLNGKIIWTIHLHDFRFKILIFQGCRAQSWDVFFKKTCFSDDDRRCPNCQNHPKELPKNDGSKRNETKLFSTFSGQYKNLAISKHGHVPTVETGVLQTFAIATKLQKRRCLPVRWAVDGFFGLEVGMLFWDVSPGGWLWLAI